MRKVFQSMIAIFGGLCLAGCAHVNPGPELKTVQNVDLQKYLGTWYEIATIPAWFEKDLVAITANYSMRPDGKIKVLNQGRKKTLDGPVDKIEGRAWIADGRDASKLKVSFFLWFAGNYWIIELDPEYQYAVVGDPSRQYLWILARSPQMDEALYQDLLGRIRGHGYDTSLIKKALQPPQL
jgi:apolipoprotein D and lipocalin family protein